MERFFSGFLVKIRKIKPCVWFWLGLVVLFIVWAFMQFHQLERAFNITYDFAQYGFAMLNWRTTGDVPLLGPHSAYLVNYIPPLYYWLIYPAYLLSNGSPFYNHIACFVYTWIILLGLALVLCKRPKYRWSYLLLIALFCFNPLILHDRVNFVWNPSYVWQPMVVAWYCLALASQSKRRILLCVIGGIACAISMSLNLLVVPVVIGFLVISILRLRKYVWAWLMGLLVAVSIFWLPVFIAGGKVIPDYNSASGQFGQFATRLRTVVAVPLIGFRSYAQYNYSKYDHIIAYGFLLVIFVFCFRKNWRQNLFESNFGQLSIALIISTIITLIPKIEIVWHYTTGLTIIIILLLVNLPRRIKLVACSLLLSWWLVLPFFNLKILRRVDLSSINTCLSQVCKYVSANQYYYALYTAAAIGIMDIEVPTYLLALAGCVPTNGQYLSPYPTDVSEVNHSYPLLVLHDLDTLAPELWWPNSKTNHYYIVLKTTLDKLYSQPVASAECDGDWGWTLYTRND